MTISFGGPRDQPPHHAQLIGIGIGHHSVQRHDQRSGNPVDQFKNHVARVAAKQAEFMLQPDDIGAARLDCGGGGNEAGRIILDDHAAHGRSKGNVIGDRGHGVDIDDGVGKGAVIEAWISAVKVAMPHRRGVNPPISAIRGAAGLALICRSTAAARAAVSSMNGSGKRRSATASRAKIDAEKLRPGRVGGRGALAGGEFAQH